MSCCDEGDEKSVLLARDAAVAPSHEAQAKCTNLLGRAVRPPNLQQLLQCLGILDPVLTAIDGTLSAQ